MGMDLSHDGSHWLLRLSGNVDIGVVGRLHAVAREAASRGGAGVVDLENVVGLDASAVQVLLSLRQTVRAAGGTIHFENAPPMLAEMWDRAGLPVLMEQERIRRPAAR